MRPCVFVIGTRAQLVKVAPVIRCASESGLAHSVWFSGQHQESMQDLLDDFEISSEVNSSSYGGEQATITSLIKWLPRASMDCYRFIRRVGASGGVPLVIIHGDTLSTLVSAWAGKRAGAEIVHLESGLSSERLLDPFPEECLRRLAFRVTDYAVCPNDQASRRMAAYACKEVLNTGENTLLDSVRYALRKVSATTNSAQRAYFVASVHRVQNIYDRRALGAIVDELISVSQVSEVRFVLHPATRKRLVATGLWDVLCSAPGITVQSRQPYTRFLGLLSNARGVFSDGGSNQEELAYLGVPTVLFRRRSERPDGLGRNVVLRQSVGDLYEYVRSGAMDRIRREPRVDSHWQPSRMTVDSLSRWASLESRA